MKPKGKRGGARPGGGRPKKYDEEVLIHTIREGLQKFGGEDALWEAIIAGAMNGNTNDRTMLVHYLYGKPTEKIKGEIKTDFIKPLLIAKYTGNPDDAIDS